MVSTPKIGFSTMIGSQAMKALPGQLDFIKGLGADVVELSALHDDLIASYRLIPGRMALLKSIIADRPLAYSVHAAIGLNFMIEPARLQPHIDVAKAYIELTAECGARHMVLHTGMYPGELTQTQLAARYGQQREALRQLGDFAAHHGVLICVENVFYWKGMHTATPSELARELELIDHNAVTATFDFGHAALNLEAVDTVFLAEAAALAPLSKHLHIHDNFGLADVTPVYTSSEALAFGEGDLHLPLHMGTIPWAALAQLSYPEDPLFMIELDPRWWREAQAMVEATRTWALEVLS